MERDPAEEAQGKNDESREPEAFDELAVKADPMGAEAEADMMVCRPGREPRLGEREVPRDSERGC